MGDGPGIAASVIETWLRAKLPPGRLKPVAASGAKWLAAWDIDLGSDFPLVPSVRLVLPPAFPAQTCELFVDKRLALRLPHVESNGRLCLALRTSPSDYQEPTGAVAEAIDRFVTGFLEKLDDLEWCESEFQEERLTYWAMHCANDRLCAGVRRPNGSIHLDATGLKEWADGQVVGYVREGGRPPRFATELVAINGVDPVGVARRLEWAGGTMVRGQALVVRMPEDEPWTPTTWPRTARELDSLLKRLTNGSRSLAALLKATAPAIAEDSRRSRFKTTSKGVQQPRVRPLPQMLVLLVQKGATYAYRVGAAGTHLAGGPLIQPLRATRIDAEWSLARDHTVPELHARRLKRVLLLGVGSLGSPLAMLLARAGIGELTLVDSDLMQPENAVRHVLGVSQSGRWKVEALAEAIHKAVPGITVKAIRREACGWIRETARPGDFDLVLDCTAESHVRSFLSVERQQHLGDLPVVHAWVEPLCSGGHVMVTTSAEPWPASDPLDNLVNASNLSVSETRIRLPACSGGFHPYGAADITQVAAFAAERVLSVVDGAANTSTVWSWVRSKAFFDRLGSTVKTRAIVPEHGGPLDTATVTRSLSSVLAAPAP